MFFYANNSLLHYADLGVNKGKLFIENVIELLKNRREV